MLKECENLSHECFEVLVMLKDVCGPQGCHVVRNFLHALSQNIGLVGNIEIELYVVGVLLTYLGIHLNIVVHFGLFVLVGMKQVFLALKVLVDFSVDLDVLEGAMEHNQDFSVDRPVIKVADVTLENKLQGTEWTHLILVLPIKTF